MGIDAEMLVRVRGDKPSEDQITRISWDLCKAIGPKHFFIEDGLPPPEYQPLSDAWHKAFNAHPLYEEFKNAMWESRQEIHKRILADIGQPPKKRRRAIELSNYLYPLGEYDEDEESDIPSTHRAPGLAYIQDGEPILAKEGEWFLEVQLFGRYYGIGYERGDILTYCAVAEWLEQNLPGCVVYYGGDSSGVCAEPFDNAEREKLKAHLYSMDGRDYFKERNVMGRTTTLRPTPCSLCVPNEDRFNQYGFGSNYAAVSCAGCGKCFVSRDNGATWQENKENS